MGQRLTRIEFTRKTKAAALARSEGRCEASGPFYNRAFDDRCNVPLVKPEFDHFIRAADGGDASLDNCRAVCHDCHAWKTTRIDTPGAAKTKRLIRANGPVEDRKKKRPIRSAPFRTGGPKKPWPKRSFNRGTP